MSRPSDFPEDQDDYVSHEDYVQGLKDRIRGLEKVVEAARDLRCDLSETHNAYDVDIEGHKRLERALEKLYEATGGEK